MGLKIEEIFGNACPPLQGLMKLEVGQRPLTELDLRALGSLPSLRHLKIFGSHLQGTGPEVTSTTLDRFLNAALLVPLLLFPSYFPSYSNHPGNPHPNTHRHTLPLLRFHELKLLLFDEVASSPCSNTKALCPFFHDLICICLRV